jgi:CRP-like cAMP-binding protein
MEKEEILGRLDIFKGLTSVELEEITQLCKDQKYPKNEVIFVQSSPGDEVYIVKKGRVHINIGLPWETEQHTIRHFTDGEVFGELAILDKRPRSATVICDSDTEVITINCDALWDLFERNNHIGYIIIRNLATMLSTRLRHTNLLLITNAAVT